MTMKWYAVGEMDLENAFEAIQAKSPQSAQNKYIKSNDVPIDMQDGVYATYVKKWQGKEKITPEDWFRSGEGMTFSCSGCGEQTNEEEPTSVCINNEVWCEFCKPEELQQ